MIRIFRTQRVLTPFLPKNIQKDPEDKQDMQDMHAGTEQELGVEIKQEVVPKTPVRVLRLISDQIRVAGIEPATN